MNNSLNRSVTVRCSIEKAFETFTTQINAWWPKSHRNNEQSEIQFEMKVGGRLFERTPDGHEKTLGEVTLCERPCRIAYTWYPGANRLPTQVDVTFTEMDSSVDEPCTLVEVAHSEGLSALGEEWPERVKKFDAAWREVLSAFATTACLNEEKWS